MKVEIELHSADELAALSDFCVKLAEIAKQRQRHSMGMAGVLQQQVKEPVWRDSYGGTGSAGTGG